MLGMRTRGTQDRFEVLGHMSHEEFTVAPSVAKNYKQETSIKPGRYDLGISTGPGLPWMPVRRRWCFPCFPTSRLVEIDCFQQLQTAGVKLLMLPLWCTGKLDLLLWLTMLCLRANSFTESISISIS